MIHNVSIGFRAQLVREYSMIAHQVPVGPADSFQTMEFCMDHRADGMPGGMGSIEWDIPATDDYACMGVWWDEDTAELTDYDGVFSLSPQACEVLELAGIRVSDDFRAWLHD